MVIVLQNDNYPAVWCSCNNAKPYGNKPSQEILKQNTQTTKFKGGHWHFSKQNNHFSEKMNVTEI